MTVTADPLDFGWVFDPPSPQPKAATACLPSERLHTTRCTKRTMVDARRLSHAREVIDHLPAPGESMHLIHVGLMDGVDLLTVALDLADLPSPHIRICTLGINERTLNTLTAFLDNGKAGRLTLLVSHYFRHVDKTLYHRVRSELASRGSMVAACRCHAKLWLAGPYTFEGSGNLRSCKSTEQIVITHDPDLADFHAAWIDDLVTLAMEGQP